MTVERVCTWDEARLWRWIEQGRIHVRIGDRDRPAGRDGKYFNETDFREKYTRLRTPSGPLPIGCPKGFEDKIREICAEFGDEPPTRHHGEEMSRNVPAFAEARRTFCYGVIDAGDDYVLDGLAECGVEARPARSDPNDGRDDPTTALCDACGGHGSRPDRSCSVCLDTSRKRARGRAFDGPDADVADACSRSQ